MDNILMRKLNSPSLKEVSNLLQVGLEKHFHQVDVQVVDCPNLKQMPFMLAAEGLCGKPTLLDVGGVPYLIPLAQKKVYNIQEIFEKVGITDAFVIGAGAGPRHHVGVNCEMMANVKLGENGVNNTHVAKIGLNNECVLLHLKDSQDFCLLGNLFASEGKPGKVLKVCAKKRISSENFVSAMRDILANHYKEQAVGMGGVFLIQSGKAKLHVMPDYSTTPLKTDEDVNKWLKFFNMSAPLICLSTFVSHDPGLDLRVEHTHCFSNHGEGGHYHHDTTPEEVEYEGYFNVAEAIYRVDPPTETHQVGRD